MNSYRLWCKYERLARLTKSKPKARQYRNRARKYWPEAKQTLDILAEALCRPLRLGVLSGDIIDSIFQVEYEDKWIEFPLRLIGENEVEKID